jgi:predicted nucleic acid-binding Zn ribbon protein
MVENGDPEYRFVCDECGESLQVNEAMRETLLEKGCVICSASVTTTEFSPE